jgi:hypothetical protein
MTLLIKPTATIPQILEIPVVIRDWNYIKRIRNFKITEMNIKLQLPLSNYPEENVSLLISKKM